MSAPNYRTILRSSSIVGAAQIANVLLGLAKMKAAAVLLGPTGIGLIGLYMSLVQTAASVASLGTNSVGTRQIAEALSTAGEAAVSHVRRALFWGTLILALSGGLVFWLLGDSLSHLFVEDARRVKDVPWLSIGVTLSVLTGGQTALLTGFRKVGDVARITVASGFLGSALGIGAIWIAGEDGIVAMVLAPQLASLILGQFFVRKIGKPLGASPSISSVMREWRVFVTLGAAVMLSGLIATSGHLLARVLVQREIGNEALGVFQAAWAVGMTYIGFALTAMATDYYPRLTSIISDRKAACRLVNEQTEVALLLGGPVLLLLLGIAPWVVLLLYSKEFGASVEVLRWQLLGDIFKVASFPLGFLILASGAGRVFVLAEFLATSVFVSVIVVFLSSLGVIATGLGYLAMYAVYLPIVWWFAARRIGFAWMPAVKIQLMALVAAALCIGFLSATSETLGAGAGVLFALIFAVWALMRLSEETGYGGRIGGLAQIAASLQRLRKR